MAAITTGGVRFALQVIPGLLLVIVAAWAGFALDRPPLEVRRHLQLQMQHLHLAIGRILAGIGRINRRQEMGRLEALDGLGLGIGDGEGCACAGRTNGATESVVRLPRPGAGRLATGDQKTKIHGVNCRSAR